MAFVVVALIEDRIQAALDAIEASETVEALSVIRKRVAPLQSDLWMQWRDARKKCIALNLAYHKRQRVLQRS